MSYFKYYISSNVSLEYSEQIPTYTHCTYVYINGEYIKLSESDIKKTERFYSNDDIKRFENILTGTKDASYQQLSNHVKFLHGILNLDFVPVGSKGFGLKIGGKTVGSISPLPTQSIKIFTVDGTKYIPVFKASSKIVYSNIAGLLFIRDKTTNKMVSLDVTCNGLIRSIAKVEQHDNDNKVYVVKSPNLVRKLTKR